MPTTARLVPYMLAFAAAPGFLSAREYRLTLEYVVLDFADSPELMPEVTRRVSFPDLSGKKTWVVAMPDQFSAEWLGRVRREVPPQLSISCHRKISIGNPTNYGGELNGFLLTVSATLLPPEGEKHPIELAFDCRPKNRPGDKPRDATELKKKQLTLVPGKPCIFTQTFDNLDTDDEGNVTDLRLKYWLVTLTELKDD